MSKYDQNTRRIPLVSVITPCYNDEEYIQDAAYSLISQNYPAIHWIFCDDGSSDNSFDKISSILTNRNIVSDDKVFGQLDRSHKELPPIKVSMLKNKQEDHGPSIVRNLCMAHASQHTEYFCPLDADDWYLPDKISKSVEVAEKDTQRIGLVYSDVLIYNEKTKNFIHEFRQPYHRGMLERECIVSNAPLINKKAIDKFGGYATDMRTAEDWHLWLRITQNFIAVHIPEPLQAYRVTGDNASDVVDKEIWNRNWQKIANLIHAQHNQK